jgi:FtsP/CotA-like multicopper oxidase with cupredoxin domain
MRLRFDGLKVSVIAVDGNPTDGFEPRDGSLPFAPGTRYDLLADLPDRPGAEGRVSAALGEGIALATFVTAGDARPPRKAGPAPRPDPGLPAAIRLENAVRRELVLQGDARTRWSINGTAGTIATPAMKVKRGSPVVLALANRTPFPQPLHLHGHAFRRLHALDDGWEPYFMDTVVVPEQRTVRIAFLADNPGRWLLASTVLERFDAGLWTWFEVT